MYSGGGSTDSTCIQKVAALLYVHPGSTDYTHCVSLCTYLCFPTAYVVCMFVCGGDACACGCACACACGCARVCVRACVHNIACIIISSPIDLTKQTHDNIVNSENIISDGFQMAEVLNEYFSSVFTTEDISSLPVPFTKFECNESEHLGQLFVTPEIIAKKIKKMKDNKSPGVDGIPPKLLKEIVEQISTPLAKVFNVSLDKGIVPSEWKEANITPLFKKGSRKKPENYRPVSLTSVVCKLLETLIRDHMVEFLVKHKLINTSQHGFLKPRSCLTNLLCFFGNYKVGR